MTLGEIRFPHDDLCYPGQTISPSRFAIPSIATTWRGDGRFRPVYLVVKVDETNNNSSYQCNFFSGSPQDSIARQLGFSSDEVSNKQGDSISANSICSINCGSFLIKNSRAGLFASGTVKLYGIQTKFINNEMFQIPISAEERLEIRYIP